MNDSNKLSGTPELAGGSGLDAQSAAEHRTWIEHHYHVECWRGGKLLWQEDFKNLVTTVGKNAYLEDTLKTAGAAAWFVGLVTGPGSGNTYAAADTMASHAGWAENTTYSNATRPAYSPAAASAGSIDNSASKAVFTINGTATIGGCFLADNSTKGGSTGRLMGVGNFATGDRAVLTGDTLNITVTATMS